MSTIWSIVAEVKSKGMTGILCYKIVLGLIQSDGTLQWLKEPKFMLSGMTVYGFTFIPVHKPDTF